MYILIGLLTLIILSIAWYLKETLSKLDDLRLMYIEQADELDKTETNLKNIRIKIEEEFQAQFDAWKQTTEAAIRADTLARSKYVQRGLATEHLAPILQSKYNPADLRFIGDPIDFLVCDGASDIHDGHSNEIKQVVLLDVKTGKSDLSKVQRRIRDAIKAGRVSFEILRLNTQESEDAK